MTARTEAGPGRGSTTPHRADVDDQKVLARVRALLAKAESTTFGEEAEALTAKAQELMARHSLDEAALAAARGRGDVPEARRIGVERPYADAKSTLLAAVARANRCRAVWSKGLGHATVLGFGADVDAVEVLYTSLLLQATTAVDARGPAVDWTGRSRTRSFRRAFLFSFAQRVGERLASAAAEAEAAGVRAHGSELLPVLAARSREVDDAFAAMFPDAVHYRPSVSHAGGWAAGRKAADAAQLHGRHLGGRARIGGGKVEP